MSYNPQRRLFKVATATGRDPAYFNNKGVAKADRDARVAPCVVMRGPDHWRGESFNVSTRTASSRGIVW